MKRTKKKLYKIKVNDRIVEFEKKVVTGEEILSEAGFCNPECYSLYQKFKGCDFEKTSLNERVDLSKKGLEKFTVKEPEIFNYSFDGEPETTDKEELTANELMELGGIKDPENYYLVEYTAKDSENKYQGDQKITMRCPGSKFVSVYDGSTPVA